jgi:hypothetical protein
MKEDKGQGQQGREGNRGTWAEERGQEGLGGEAGGRSEGRGQGRKEGQQLCVLICVC